MKINLYAYIDEKKVDNFFLLQKIYLMRYNFNYSTHFLFLNSKEWLRFWKNISENFF